MNEDIDYETVNSSTIGEYDDAEMELTPLTPSPKQTLPQDSILNDTVIHSSKYEQIKLKDEEECTENDENYFNEIEIPKKEGIGYIGSMSIVVNYLVGPAMLNLPSTYQTSGFIPTTLVIIVVCILEISTSLNLANVISKIPHNQQFQKQIEYSDTFRIYLGRMAFIFTHVVFFGCLICQTIASIIDTAQVVDEFIVSYFNTTKAVRMYPFPVEMVSWNQTDCLDKGEEKCEPFNTKQDGVLLLSTGYLICCVVFLPMGLMDLKENTAFQIFGFLLLVIISIQFIIVFCERGLEYENLSLWGTNWSDLFGIILFNYTFATAIPSWLSEKSDKVDVPHMVRTSSWLSSLMYILVGSLGALSIQNVSDNMLSSMIIGDFGKVTQVFASLFAFFIIGLGIPLFCVLMRMNLMGSGLLNGCMANGLAVFLPWTIAWLFYKGSACEKLLSWGGIIFTSIVAFVAPLSLSYYAVSFSKEHGSIRIWGCFTLSPFMEKCALVCLLLLALVLITFPITEVIVEHFL